jgi:hypothetical protein
VQAAGMMSRVASVAVRAQHAALLDLGQQISPASEGGDHRYFATLVSQVVELENHGVVLAAANAGMLAQVVINV